MKKERAKKAAGTKKKEEKTEAEAEASTAVDKTEEKSDEIAPEPVEATSASPGPVEDDDEPSELPTPKPSHGRKPSVAIESRQRSESFYRSGAANTPTSPSAVTPGGGITSEVYREQAQRIEELEKENKRLANEVEENQNRWKKGEEELEELREGRGDVALAVEKGKEADKLVWRLATNNDDELTRRIESRSRVAQKTIVPSSITKRKVNTPHIDRITKSILIYRRFERAGRVEVRNNRVA
mgnify:CR=1 FL=1|tara:strand:- start:4385 stop:5107 length:723 start_codon:yes stop_codon:yes gene_type:complete